MIAFSINVKLPESLERLLENAGEQVTFTLVGLSALLLLACFLLFHRHIAARVTGLGLIATMLLWSFSHIAPAKPQPKPALPSPLRPKRPKEDYPFPPPSAMIQQMIGAITIGGPVAPDGKRQVVCDLPVDQRTRNVGGRDGAGLCVFSSIGHAARWQNERRLEDFQKKMRAEPGGGYPSKVDAMIAKYGKGAQYVQYEGSDPTILEAALKTGRMVSVTYNGRDPHYRGTIAHMVNLVYLDADLACVLDNNFVGENELVWLSRQEFLSRWTGGGGGWAVVLLNPPPPPPPHN